LLELKHQSRIQKAEIVDEHLRCFSESEVAEATSAIRPLSSASRRNE
jgi:hypothetical protein